MTTVQKLGVLAVLALLLLWKPSEQARVITEGGLHVLILESAADRDTFTKGQRQALDALEIKAYLKSKQSFWRKLDVATDNIGELESTYQRMFKAATEAKGFKVPWVFISNGRREYNGPWLDGIGENMALLKKYGG